MRIKDITTKVGSGVTPKGGATVYQDGGIPLFRSQNITNDGLLTDDIAYISEEIHNSMSGSQLKPNDVLLNITGASIGRCYYLPEDFTEGNVNQHVCIIRLKKNVLPAFLYYNLISATGQRLIDCCQTGANREGLTKEDLCNFEFEIPSTERQKEIVEYLNEKISLITNQVSLLTSKRDAYLRLKKSIINRAVTKGLNPNAAMKDSGIDWIGEVPEGWEAQKLKRVALIQTGNTPSTEIKRYWENSTIDWYTPGDFNEDLTYLESSLRKISTEAIEEKAAKIFPCNTVLLVGIGATLGKVALSKNECSANQQVNGIILEDSMFPQYVTYLLFSARSYIKSLSNSATLPILNQMITGEIQICIPPLSEQRAIATYLDDKCSKIDRIISNLDKQISKYGDLKRSLIDEVITGKRAV